MNFFEKIFLKMFSTYDLFHYIPYASRCKGEKNALIFRYFLIFPTGGGRMEKSKN